MLRDVFDRPGSPVGRLGGLLLALIPLLAIAPNTADASCTHTFFIVQPMQGSGMKLTMTENTATEPAVGEWAIEACFSVSNQGGAAETIEVTLVATDHAPSGLDFPIIASTSKSIGPGSPAPISCSVQGGTIGKMVNASGIAPGNLTDLCCFTFEAIPPKTCNELLGTANGTPYDTVRVEMVTSAGSVFDDSVLAVSADPDLSGPGCGLVGLELLVPVWMVGQVLRRRRAGT